MRAAPLCGKHTTWSLRVVRHKIRRGGRLFFWLSKWLVAAVLLVGAVLVGVILLVRSDIDFDTFLNYFALGLLIFVLITLFYAILAIHDVPYDIARHRDHPHQDAIHVAGWVSLFTLHAIWPFLWIWAMLYRPDRSWGVKDSPPKGVNSSTHPTEIDELRQRVIELERRSDTRVH
jgi:Protein of unknown function (DUF3302)